MFDVAHDAAREAAAQVRRRDLDLQLRIVGRLHRRETRAACSGAPVSADSSRATPKTLSACARLGVSLSVKSVSSSFSTLAHVRAHGRIGRQFEQAAMVLAQLELARRAQHALALDAAQLAELDQERLAVLAGRQFGARPGRSGTLMPTRAFGAPQTMLSRRALPRVDLAHAQAVGVRVLGGFLDFADHDLGERRRRPGAALRPPGRPW